MTGRRGRRVRRYLNELSVRSNMRGRGDNMGKKDRLDKRRGGDSCFRHSLRGNSFGSGTK